MILSERGYKFTVSCASAVSAADRSSHDSSLSTVQSAALHGDLSLPRGTILQMKDALEYEEDADADFDYFS